MSRTSSQPFVARSDSRAVPDQLVPVDVVILTWNDEPLLRRAAASVFASTGVDPHVIVVDNGSQPPVARGALGGERVQLIRNAENRGVAPGRAQGVDAGDAEFVCLLDSDAELPPDSLRRMLDWLATHPDVGLVAPSFVDQDPDQSAGLAPSAAVKVQRVLGRTDLYESAGPFSDEGARDVDFAIGACQVFRRDAYESISGLDTSIFYGPEDVDFCLRLRNAGWRITQLRDATCIHPPRRSNRRILTRRGAEHALAVGKNLWRHRDFRPPSDPTHDRHYNLHGLCSLAVDEEVVGAPVIEEILGHFRSDEGRADIRIVRGADVAARIAGIDRREGHNGPGFVYGSGWFTTQSGNVLIARHADGLLIGADRNVDRSLLPLIDWAALPRGATMIHGAAVSIDGAAALITGWGGVGKTATLARLCTDEGASFLADDMLLVSSSQQAYSLPKPMYIYPYHAPLFPELFASEHKRLVPVALTPATERLRNVVRPLITLSPEFENWARKVTPEHMKTPPAKALPGMKITESAQVRLIIRLERSGRPSTESTEIARDELAEGLVAEFFGEATATTGMELPMGGSSSGVFPIDHWMRSRRAVLDDLVAGPETVRVRMSADASAEDTAELVTNIVTSVLR